MKNKEVHTWPDLLSCGPLQPQAGWTLQGEDPALFTKDRLWPHARREWVDTPYPTTPDAPAAPEGSTPVMSAADMEELYKIHHTYTKMILKHGGDPCKHFKEVQVENILAGIKSSDLQCKVCEKSYSSASRMKRHMMKRHLGKTNYQCPQCKKYYTDASSLKEHSHVHNPALNPFKCDRCDKSFPSKSKKDAHQLKHLGNQWACKYAEDGCTKTFAWKRGKVDHEGKCSFNPDAPKKEDKPRFTCDLCGRGYADSRSVLRHKREKH